MKRRCILFCGAFLSLIAMIQSVFTTVFATSEEITTSEEQVIPEEKEQIIPIPPQEEGSTEIVTPPVEETPIVPEQPKEEVVAPSQPNEPIPEQPTQKPIEQKPIEPKPDQPKEEPVPDLILSVAKRNVNGTDYNMKTYSRVRLQWPKIPNTTKYVLQKYNSSKKKYVDYKTIKSSATSIDLTGLSAATTYKFKIKAYKDKKVLDTSNVLSVKTMGKTDGYFAHQIVLSKAWSGIKYSAKKASNATMDQYTINGIKAPIKYNYCSENNTLYIHAYVKFEGDGCNKKVGTYKKIKTGKYKKTGSAKYTYKDLAISGIKKWSQKVTGNSYNFIKGCNFKTYVVLHTNVPEDQNYIRILIGDELCKKDGDYWFRAGGFSYYKVSNKAIRYDYGDTKGGQTTIYLSTNEQLVKNKHRKGKLYAIPKTKEEYKSSVAHEFGHTLGLADAYDKKNEKGKTIKRITKTSEVGYYKKKKFISLMYGPEIRSVVDNDIEMALQAQGDAIADKDYSIQAYRSHTMDGVIYKKSSVIRKK